MTTAVRWLSRITLGVASLIFLRIAGKCILGPHLRLKPRAL